MRAKDLAQAALLLAIGFILRVICPPILLGMKPDFSLTMMFIILMIKRGDRKLGFLVALATGIFAALTTAFPGGQVANIIDKLVTFTAVSAIIPLVMDRINNRISAGIITLIGTIISGTVFLGSAYMIVGLPGPFSVLFYSVVLPAALINTVVAVVIYAIVEYSMGITSRKEEISV